MEEVWIFGDSYAADCYYPEEEKYAWPLRLKNLYNVENFAYPGTGPEHAMKVFRNQILHCTSEELSNISVIFVLSHDSRKDFSFLDSLSDQCSMFVMDQNFKKYNKKNQNFIKKFYKEYYMHNELGDFRHLQYVGILKEFSRFFKKILVIPAFDDYKSNTLYEKFDSQIEDYENFYYSKGPALFFIEKEKNNDPNHLSLINHSLMFENLKAWLENSHIFDTNNLQKIFDNDK